MDAVFITARLKSSRLKRKVLMKVGGDELINYQISRLKSLTDKKIILTTSTNTEDDPLITIAEKAGIDYFRGSEEDVLDRYLQACKVYGVTKFYVVYGDEPFVDTDCLLTNFDLMQEGGKVVVINDKLPDGTFGYGITFEAVEYLVQEKNETKTEVWGTLLNELTLIKVINNTESLGSKYEEIRLTVDYIEDFQVFEKIIAIVGSEYACVPLSEIVKVYQENNFYSINGERIDEYNRRIQEQGVKG